MMGKQKCKILKEIRQRIADENDIPYVTRECTHKGDCRGTCPRCESELRYLEQQLQKRQAMGKKVAVAALCAGLAFTAAGCDPVESLFGGVQTRLSGEVSLVSPEPGDQPEEIEVETGEVAFDPDLELSGALPAPTPPSEDPDVTAGEPEPEEWELMGEVLFIPEAPAENGNG